MYRYYDARGVLHVESVLPPGQAQSGYEVLDRRTLKTLAVITPAPSPQELAEQERRRRDAAAAQAAAQRSAQARQRDAAQQRYRDQMLLQTYASEAELIRLRNTKLETMALILRSVEQTVGHLRGNLAQMDATVVEHEAAGRVPPADLLEARARTAADLAEQERAAERIHNDQAAIRDTFESDLNRYRLLMGAR
ncbi:hypothetical protein [Immundisolibacter cernigliae]|uniref:hypothetical protein n=1 Tax=Immundisolibacter cernigliae TaxID=1810504 RepID=UPI0011AB83E3|nr:hypothetical protein [Immundisolibacter cernigliae]